MRQIILLFCFKMLSVQTLHAQDQFVTKILMPQKKIIAVFRPATTPVSGQTFIKPVAAAGTNIPLLHFNDQAVLQINNSPAKKLQFFSQLSFGDLLENSMNRLKNGLVNTYDDYIPELFKDAPSIFKIKCVIAL